MDRYLDYQERLVKAQLAIAHAEYLIIGGGAGLSSAAGLEYSGRRFTDNFADFIVKYGMEDMYSATFYPFETEEERWAYWARHILLNRHDAPATKLYRKLLALVGSKPHFVLTTNVEGQFAKAGFDAHSIFATQGDYGFLQCARACHDTLYPNEQLIRHMAQQTRECRIPSPLVPTCPVCGGKMDVNLRKDSSFVETAAWHRANEHYASFLRKAKGKRIVFLELGVGYNTPGIIRNPFEQLTYLNPHTTLIRMNKYHAAGLPENAHKTIAFSEDMADVIEFLIGGVDDQSREACLSDTRASAQHTSA